MDSASENADLIVETHHDKKVFRFKLKGDIENQEWAYLFESVLKRNTDLNTYRFLVDSRFGHDRIDINGFQKLGELFRQYKVQDCSICVLTSDKGMKILKNLFLNVMKTMGFDVKCQVFFSEQNAVKWLVR